MAFAEAGVIPASCLLKPDERRIAKSPLLVIESDSPLLWLPKGKMLALAS